MYVHACIYLNIAQWQVNVAQYYYQDDAASCLRQPLASWHGILRSLIHMHEGRWRRKSKVACAGGVNIETGVTVMVKAKARVFLARIKRMM